MIEKIYDTIEALFILVVLLACYPFIVIYDWLRNLFRVR